MRKLILVLALILPMAAYGGAFDDEETDDPGLIEEEISDGYSYKAMHKTTLSRTVTRRRILKESPVAGNSDGYNYWMTRALQSDGYTPLGIEESTPEIEPRSYQPDAKTQRNLLYLQTLSGMLEAQAERQAVNSKTPAKSKSMAEEILDLPFGLFSNIFTAKK